MYRAPRPVLQAVHRCPEVPQTRFHWRTDHRWPVRRRLVVLRAHSRFVPRESCLSNRQPDQANSERMESLPEPSSEEVNILKVSPKKYAVITFPGYANNEKINKYAKKLLKSIKSEGLKTVGNVKFMGYNAPWQVIGRKNEIAVEVK